jgi:hypothetical protein
MSSITIVENEYITVEYWIDKQLIRHTIHKPIDGETFKAALDAGTEALAKYQARKWLSDDRKNGPLPPETMNWAFNDWGPRTIAAGWQYWANVVPQELAAAGTLVPVIEHYHEKGLRMMVFSDVDPAIEWLDRVESTSPSK